MREECEGELRQNCEHEMDEGRKEYPAAGILPPCFEVLLIFPTIGSLTVCAVHNGYEGLSSIKS